MQSKISEVCAVVEEQHGGKVPDHVLKEMLLMVKEAAMPSLEGPETVQGEPPCTRSAGSFGGTDVMRGKISQLLGIG